MIQRHLCKSLALALLSLPAYSLPEALAADAGFRSEFANPPPRWQSRPLWFWNGKLDVEKTKGMVAACKTAGYHGMGILPSNGMGVDFMSPEFLKQYKVAVDAAGKLGMKMCLYDEFWFPSGSAGGLLAQKHPEALGKRLDMLAADVSGPKEFTQAVPEGTLMGAVAMEAVTRQRLDITAWIKDGTLSWKVPAGEWKVMIFTCVPDGGDGLVDYLEPKAVNSFIKLTYQAYHDAMPEHFGTTIDGAFYDEPAFYHVKGGRAWTDRFNERFRARFKTNPVTLYPALWFDIGPDTAAARNALFGMRTELYATGFVKTINDWCAAHHMDLTGHADQEEVVNPVIGTVGDLIKSFKHQSMPGIDQIGAYGRASRAYKVVSSAANNYDRPLVVTECYGAMDLPLPNLYKEAMDQFAKGINVMVPHAVWYDPATIVFQPDLSPGAPKYGPELPAYNQYIGRLQRMLQGGRHVADIGVLYPIATLQAGSWFGPGNPYEGCVDIPEADYMQVGEALSLGVRRDFTFVHPEVLEERCAVDGAAITLNNKVNHERWRAFIIPGSRCINIATLRLIKKFYDQGGTVIATTRLPDRAAEFGADAEVRQLVDDIFGDRKSCHRNAKGGKAWFLPSPEVTVLKAVLAEALPDGDVVIGQELTVSGGNFSYIHKVKEGKPIYFFGNSSDVAVDTWVALCGKLDLETWNPHDGRIGPAEVEHVAGKEGPVTRVHVKLTPVRSLFLVAAGTESMTLAQTTYPDGRPSATLRMEAKDQGTILKHGDGPGQCDYLGAREALIFEEKGVYHLFYDGAGPKGWLACLATSKDLKTWEKKGPILDFGKPGASDSAAACSPWVYFDGTDWHMFYLGTPNVSGAPDLIPSFPYLTLKARSKSLAGPWIKQPDVIPFSCKPNTYYAHTASPGHIVKQGDEYLMFFSASMKRTLSIARTKDLNGPWAIDPQPIVSPEEQIENSSLYFEQSNKTWFLFTNHIGLDGGEYTDAVWVYWSKDLNRWDAKNKAVVLDGKNCTWSKKCIGMPSVVRVGKRLAIFYDAPGGDSTSHMERDIGLAWLELPLSPPKQK